MAMIGNDCFPGLLESALTYMWPWNPSDPKAGWSRGFRAKVLLAGQWDQEPAFRDGFIALGIIGIIISVYGIIQYGLHGFIQIPSTKRMDPYVRITEHVIPFLFCLWQFWLGLLVALLPSQWLSSVTFAIIILHVWAELPNFVIRVVMLDAVNKKLADEKLESNLHLATRIMQVVAFVNFVLYLTTGNPYIQGLLGSFSFVADFGNFFATAILAGKMVKLRRERMIAQGKNPDDLLNKMILRAHGTREVIMASMQIVHVLKFYVHVAFACGPQYGDRVQPAAAWLLAWEAVMIALYLVFVVLRFVFPVDEDPNLKGGFEYLRQWFTNPHGVDGADEVTPEDVQLKHAAAAPAVDDKPHTETAAEAAPEADKPTA